MSEESKDSRMTNEEAVAYLSSFMGKSIFVTTTDQRKFFGTMKCTDRVSRIFVLIIPYTVAVDQSNALWRVEISY